MKHNSCICIDAGTANCPCPLAETGDCLVCSRLTGRDKCDCSWCGLCIYNEFIQNDKKARNKRKDAALPIVSRRWYSSDLVVLEIEADKKTVLEGSKPGTIMFLNGTQDPYFAVPVSIMRTDMQRSTLSFALKIISAKTKAIAKAEGKLFARGVYRNGLLGEGVLGSDEERWLFLTKGVGFAPAVNIIDHLPAGILVDMVIDTEKITEEIVSDNLSKCDSVREGRVKIDVMPLGRLLDNQDAEALRCIDAIENYAKIFILASDHYIDTLKAAFNVPDSKLIYANNFHMCCGEGICGACCHIDENGIISRMCKCRKR